MAKIRIRKATLDDLNKIIHLIDFASKNIEKYLINHILDFTTQNLYDKEIEIIVAIIDMEIVGYLYKFNINSDEINEEILRMTRYNQNIRFSGFESYMYISVNLFKNWQKGVYKKLLETVISNSHMYEIGILSINYSDYIELNEQLKELDVQLLKPFSYAKDEYNILYFKTSESELKS